MAMCSSELRVWVLMDAKEDGRDFIALTGTGTAGDTVFRHCRLIFCAGDRAGGEEVYGVWVGRE